MSENIERKNAELRILENKENQRINRLKAFFGKAPPKRKVKVKKRGGMKASVFNNSQINKAFESLSKDEKEMYKLAGEQLYNNEMVTASDPLSVRMEESFAYISHSIKAGLHPSELDFNELTVMEECGGEKWYEEFGYSKNDI